MKKLIYIGMIIAILAITLMAVPAGARIITEPSPKRLFSEYSFSFQTLCGVKVTGGLIAYETPYREIKLTAMVTQPYWQNTMFSVYAGVGLYVSCVPGNNPTDTDSKTRYGGGKETVQVGLMDESNDDPIGGDAMLIVDSLMWDIYGYTCSDFRWGIWVVDFNDPIYYPGFGYVYREPDITPRPDLVEEQILQGIKNLVSLSSWLRTILSWLFG